FEATGKRAYLDQALTWQRAFDLHYANPDIAGYFATADDAEGLIVRPNATSDDAIPNPNAIAAQNLIRLAVLNGDDRWREAADRLIEGVLAVAAPNFVGHAALLNAIDLRLGGLEIVVIGFGQAADTLAETAVKLPFINRSVLRASSSDQLTAHHPARAKIEATLQPAAFVCSGATCSLPMTDPRQLAILAGNMPPPSASNSAL
ncbi:MAG TPA: thioredoxin domain-containing protein, partial [Xanthobacteraceae bacterium]|nr:thioredoxin domain-containing protein [Xanthobacteraceae bacterium]